MKIVLNATCFNNRPSGANQRFLRIYSDVFKRADQHEFLVFTAKDERLNEWFEPQPNVSFIETPIVSAGRLRKAMAGARYWPQAFKRLRPDVVEAFHLPVITARKATNILTVHDIGPLREYSGAGQRLLYRATLDYSVHAADHIVTVSEFMRQELLDLYPDKDISVIYNGIDPVSFSRLTEDAVEVIRKRHNLPARFLLAVGHFSKRKNYRTLLDAFSILVRRGVVQDLVLVGNDSGELEDLVRHAGDLGIRENVHFKIGLSDDEVRGVYKLCELFVFPSTYEGFGIPILEAMAAERPMAVSDLAVFKEITEGNSAYFDPADQESMADVISRVLQSPALVGDQVQYGRRRVRDFSFGVLADQTVQIYEKLL